MAKAYALFDSKARKEELEEELVSMRSTIKLPSELELLLTELKEATDLDPNLLKLINQGEIYPIIPSKLKHLMVTDEPIPIRLLKYLIKANHPTETVDKVTDYLGEIANGIYQAYDSGAPCCIEIIGQELDGSYSIFGN